MSIQVLRETDVNTRFDGQGVPHSELAVGAFSTCSVVCWEKTREGMARCECCGGFQGEVAGGCQAALLLTAGSVEGILSRAPLWSPFGL